MMPLLLLKDVNFLMTDNKNDIITELYEYAILLMDYRPHPQGKLLASASK